MTYPGHYRIAFPEDVARRIGLASRRLIDGIIADALRDAERRGETLQAPEEPSPYRYGSAELDEFFEELGRKDAELMRTPEYREAAARLREKMR